MRISGPLAIIIVIGANYLNAQPPSVSNIDSAKLASDIGASYYHPDGLTGLDCGATVDYAGLFKQLGQSPPDELRKQLAGIAIKVRAMANQVPKIDIAWQDGAPTNKESIESGLRQTLGGFF